MKPPRGAGHSMAMPDSAPAVVGGGGVGGAGSGAGGAPAAAAAAAKTVVVKEGHVSKIASRFQQFETNSGDILVRKPEPLSLMTKPNRITIGDVDNASAHSSVRFR